MPACSRAAGPRSTTIRLISPSENWRPMSLRSRGALPTTLPLMSTRYSVSRSESSSACCRSGIWSSNCSRLLTFSKSKYRSRYTVRFPLSSNRTASRLLASAAEAVGKPPSNKPSDKIVSQRVFKCSIIRCPRDTSYKKCDPGDTHCDQNKSQ